jgi:hypothetical protein
MVILSLLSLNSNKRLRHKKAEVKKIKIILSIIVAMLIMSIVIPTVLATNLMRFMLLNFVGLPRPNLMLVILSRQFIKIGKKKLNLILMWLNVTRFLMNYIKLTALKCLKVYFL